MRLSLHSWMERNCVCGVSAWFAAVLVLSACGPGTGGTGSGETASALDAYGAAPANVCVSGPIAALACTAPANAGTRPDVINNPAPAFSTGTDGVLFADISKGQEVGLGITGNRAALTARCLDLRFDGDWAVTINNDARFFGLYTRGANGQPRLASLTVQAAGSDNKSLSAVLRDQDERVLLGPLLLLRVPVPVSNPQACPG